MRRVLLAAAVFCVGAFGQVTTATMRTMMSETPAAPSCVIVTSSLPTVNVGSAYSQTLVTNGCTAPLAWDLAAGSMCTNLSLGASTGIISGTPLAPQTCSFTARVTDNLSAVGTMPLSITVTPITTIIGGRTVLVNVVIR